MRGADQIKNVAISHDHLVELGACWSRIVRARALLAEAAAAESDLVSARAEMLKLMNAMKETKHERL